MRFLARQPVFDRSMNVVGYELLFRSGWHNTAHIGDQYLASQSTLDHSAVVGLDVLCEGKPAFINCTRELLTGRLVELFPPEAVVVEVLEHVRADDEVLHSCRELKRAGYVIALDDVVSLSDVKPFISVIDIVKVDFRLTDPKRRRALTRVFRGTDISLLAEKVETQEEHQQACEMGFRYFQGYFFQKPAVMRSNEIPALKLNYLRLLGALHASPLDLREVEEIVEGEPSLCYRVLRYLNSPLFAFRTRIHSVHHALALLGEDETRRWLSVAAAVGVAEAKAPEVISWALTRAKFCESLGTAALRTQTGAFLLGLVSALPALLDLPLETILERLPLASAIDDALRGSRNRHRLVLDTVLAYEAGDWHRCAQLAGELDISEELLTQSYVEAVTWAQKLGRVDPVLIPG